MELTTTWYVGRSILKHCIHFMVESVNLNWEFIFLSSILLAFRFSFKESGQIFPKGTSLINSNLITSVEFITNNHCPAWIPYWTLLAL